MCACVAGGVLVLVTGSMTKKGMSTPRRFAQSFFLARQNVGTTHTQTENDYAGGYARRPGEDLLLSVYGGGRLTSRSLSVVIW